ncbi:MAG TPA: alkaline phosphatase family protein [Rubrobacter sp.]|nr:alkaline phosphatase family protein [Rubrobacter sp.]
MTSPENNASPKPVLLLVLDGIRPDVLRVTIREGGAPSLGALAERGEAVWDAVSVFPSITPAATAAIATGEAPSGSGIVGHAWYDEGERRVVVYGAMTETVIATGPIKVFHNNVWRMNRDDLYASTLFETLHDRGFDGACVNFPVRRGPHTHPIRLKTVEGYRKNGRYLGPSVEGPREYFMGDLFYSRETGHNGRKASGGLRRSVGINDEYAARIGAMLVREKAAPFNLVYFFKGDSIAHHHGIEAQRRWVEKADGYVSRIFEAGGGIDQVLEDYAVLALSDHGHVPLLPGRRHVDLRRIPGQKVSSGVRATFGNGTTVVVVPNGRSALLYLRDAVELGSVVENLVGRRGVDLAAWTEGEWGMVRRLGRTIRFRPGPGPRDAFGRSWDLEGDPRTLDLDVSDGEVRYGDYPDALERLWGCMRSPRCGDVVLSAVPGYTFGEVSGGYHKASDHGSLHAGDSEVFVLASGVPAPRRITDVASTLLDHFGTGMAAENLVG